MQLDVGSFANVGSQSSPFQTNDIIGANAGLFLGIGGPSDIHPGFLQVHDIQDIADVALLNGSVLYVQHDLANVGDMRLLAQGTAEVGHDFPSTTAIVFQNALIRPLGGYADFRQSSA